MKSFFENNRNYFEQKGIAQKLKKPAGGNGGYTFTTATVVGSGVCPEQDWQHSANLS